MPALMSWDFSSARAAWNGLSSSPFSDMRAMISPRRRYSSRTGDIINGCFWTACKTVWVMLRMGVSFLAGEAAVVDRFRDVVVLKVLGPVQVGRGPSKLEDAVMRTAGEAEA